MKLATKNVKLTEKDKMMLLKYLDVCTDLNGHNCNIIDLKKGSSKLNLE
jgi:hypothetical protein